MNKHVFAEGECVLLRRNHEETIAIALGFFNFEKEVL